MVQTLTAEEAHDWLRKNGSVPPAHTFQRLRTARGSAQHNFEQASPAKVLSLARDAVLWLEGRSSRAALLVIHERGVWESSELPALFALIRGDAGTPERLDTLPAHHFEPGAEGGPPKLLIESLWLTMCFGWGVRVHAAGTGRFIQTDHDGFLWKVGDAIP